MTSFDEVNNIPKCKCRCNYCKDDEEAMLKVGWINNCFAKNSRGIKVDNMRSLVRVIFTTGPLNGTKNYKAEKRWEK